MVSHATDGSLQQRLLGVAIGLACGRERLQKVLWVPRKGAMWCVYFCTLHLECYGLPTKTSTRFARGSALLVPEGAKIGAPSGISFLGTHNTFWRSSLPRRALQT